MFKKIIFLVVLFASLSFKAKSTTVLSPQITCVSVLPNGNISLTWLTPTDPSGVFSCYDIYRSTNGFTPFTLVTSVFSYTTTTYTDFFVNANLASVYYYIETRSGSPIPTNAPAFDTVKSIHLNLIPSFGTANIAWNAISNSSTSTSSGIYSIYQISKLGVQTLQGTSTNTNYVDEIFVCHDSLSYKVEISDNTGCTSVSSVINGLFDNKVVPATSLFDTLSVDDNNNAIMSWNANPSSDVEGYLVYYVNTIGANVLLDTVVGINNISYNYSNLPANASGATEQFLIAAYDSCKNGGLFGFPLSTIHLKSTADICNRTATLNWTPYDSLIGNGLAGYRIYQSSISSIGPYTLIDTVSAHILTYTVNSLAPNKMYYYKVQAFDLSGTKTSSSNRISRYSAAPIPPAFSYLRKVTVVSNNRIDITCHVDVAASVLKYKIFRSLDTVSSHFKHIATIPVSGISPIMYSDNKVTTTAHSYYYKVINVDSCGYDGLESNVSRSILLSVYSKENMTNVLNWNNYETWEGGIVSYNIYRGIDGVFEIAPIASVTPGSDSTVFVDDVSLLVQGNGVFNYYIEGIEGFGTPFNFGETSLSNQANAFQDPSVYIPNAFRPMGGYTTKFTPLSTYIDFTEYEFNIFNRFGNLIFSSTNISEGWDGTKGGNVCDFGVYVYFLRYKTSKGEYKERKGTVTLLN